MKAAAVAATAMGLGACSHAAAAPAAAPAAADCSRRCARSPSGCCRRCSCWRSTAGATTLRSLHPAHSSRRHMRDQRLQRSHLPLCIAHRALRCRRPQRRLSAQWQEWGPLCLLRPATVVHLHSRFPSRCRRCRPGFLLGRRDRRGRASQSRLLAQVLALVLALVLARVQAQASAQTLRPALSACSRRCCATVQAQGQAPGLGRLVQPAGAAREWLLVRVRQA